MSEDKEFSSDNTLEQLGLPPRALNVFQSEGIHSIEDLLKHADEDLLRLPNFGKTALEKVKSILGEKGLVLGKGYEKPKLNEAPPEKEKGTNQQAKEIGKPTDTTENRKPTDPVSKLDLSQRAFNCLQSSGIETVGQLNSLEQDLLLRIPNLGPIAVEQILKTLAKIEIVNPETLVKPPTEEISNHGPGLDLDLLPNVTVKSNVWINAADPARNLSEASSIQNIEKAKKAIPGDYMIDFINEENPLEDPTNVSIIRNVLTSRQRAEYIAYRYFLKAGASGYIAEQNIIRKASYYDLERYLNGCKKLSRVTINGDLLLRANGWLPDGSPSKTKVQNGNGFIYLLNDRGEDIGKEIYRDGLLV